MTADERPTRVAVIGGGCASLTTAFELTRPEHQGRFEVTVYQMGWRLGGKGASGRGVADRIEEHGLHLWMGFYENAFRLMRDCYAERQADGRARRFADWQDAFTPAPAVTVMDKLPQGGWDRWHAHFPAGQGLPGDPMEEGSPFTVQRYLRQSAMLIAELLRSAQQIVSEREPSSTTATLNRYGQFASMAALFEASETLRHAMDTWLPQMVQVTSAPIIAMVDAIAGATRRQLTQMVSDDSELRRIWEVIDVVLAVVRGATINAMAIDARGFDAINQYDWREWLRMNGASDQSLDSGFVRGIYDLTFGFEDGDVTRPRFAAGVALRAAMRMFFTYRGALFWRMNAGMGDVVFAPLYEVLKRRGVRFEFFHRLKDVKLAPARKGETPYVNALDFDVQARTKAGKEYQPLVEINGMSCWPAKPDYRQLVRGAAMEREGRAFEAHWEARRAGTKRLKVGDDFDFVVLGVSIGAIPHVASELIERDPRWRDMVKHVETVPTQAFQLWMREDMASLGWTHRAGSLSGYVEPFDTWADMSHLIGEENWAKPVKSIAYFCSVLPDAARGNNAITESFHEKQRALVRNNAIRFLNRDVGILWPDAANAGGGFRWDLLVSDDEPTAAARRKRADKRFDTQFWTANVNPSDRYVLSLPGSLEYRLSPLDMGFDNLTIAGDWTASGLDSGCIESAVMSGRLAAHALSRQPALEDIIGYDHP